jgi:hypothetical protein
MVITFSNFVKHKSLPIFSSHSFCDLNFFSEKKNMKEKVALVKTGTRNKQLTSTEKDKMTQIQKDRETDIKTDK